MYFLKVKGKASIPDYLQIRDNDFTLVAYFKLKNAKENLMKLGVNPKHILQILTIIQKTPFGKIQKFKFPLYKGGIKEDLK